MDTIAPLDAVETMNNLGGFIEGLVLPLTLALSVLLVALVVFVFVRRGGRHLYFRKLDEARRLCAPLVERMFAGSIGYGDGLNRLRARSWPGSFIEAILMEDRNPLWRLRLASPLSGSRLKSQSAAGVSRRIHPWSFVLRAEAAENLGIIRHQPSWELLMEALGDSHLTVRSVAARALGRIQEPLSFRALTDRLLSASLDPTTEMSTRTLKMALASFPLSQAAPLGNLLEHRDGRVRFLAIDVLAVTAEREAAEHPQGQLDPKDVPPPILEISLTLLPSDKNPDVRARAADLIGRLADARSLPILLRLLGDPEWFVRMHAVRALAHQGAAPLAAICLRLTDRHWRVREAAAGTLCAAGRPGVARLIEHFLSTRDPYSQEQIAEQFERTGLIPSLVETFGDPGRESESRFIEEMVRLGKGSMLLPALRNGWAAHKRELLLESLSRHPDPTIHSFARQLKGNEASGAPQRSLTASAVG